MADDLARCGDVSVTAVECQLRHVVPVHAASGRAARDCNSTRLPRCTVIARQPPFSRLRMSHETVSVRAIVSSSSDSAAVNGSCHRALVVDWVAGDALDEISALFGDHCRSHRVSADPHRRPAMVVRPQTSQYPRTITIRPRPLPAVVRRYAGCRRSTTRSMRCKSWLGADER